MNIWQRKDLQYIWHPYTQMKDAFLTPPILIEQAQGIKLYDNEGNFYYDTIASWWCNVHGHNHPKIKEAIKRQLDSLEHVLFAGFTHKGAILLAQELVRIAPAPLSKVFFSDNGSTAVEVALKMSFQYWQNTGRREKRKFLCLDYAYHGDTIGAMSVGGVDLFGGLFRPLFFSSYRAPAPYCYRCPQGKQKESCRIECVDLLEEALKENADSLAAVILEPLVLAAGGMIIYPAQYLKKVKTLTQKYNVHLILDEVATGFGRTGEMFACDHAGVAPDFMCLSKGITAGYLPLGGTLTTSEVYDAFCGDYAQKTFFHGHTYTANPLACAAALASLEIFRQEAVLDKLKKVIPLFHKSLEKFKSLPYVGDVRALGMIGAMELVKDKDTKEGFPAGVGLEIYKRGLKENIILRPLGNVIYLFLPLCINAAELEDILSRLNKTVENCFVELFRLNDKPVYF